MSFPIDKGCIVDTTPSTCAVLSSFPPLSLFPLPVALFIAYAPCQAQRGSRLPSKILTNEPRSRSVRGKSHERVAAERVATNDFAKQHGWRQFPIRRCDRHQWERSFGDGSSPAKTARARESIGHSLISRETRLSITTIDKHSAAISNEELVPACIVSGTRVT